MNKSKEKGTRAELALRNILRRTTGLEWERTPGSGAMNSRYKMKGDLYIPNEKNYYLIEVKHFKEDQLSSRVLTLKDPTLFDWWNKACQQSEDTGMEPLLIYKFDRSKWYVVSKFEYTGKGLSLNTGENIGHIQDLDSFLEAQENIKWVA